MEKISKVYVDYRENKRINVAQKKYKEYNPLVVNMDYGDFIFYGNKGKQVLFEYKTTDDFFNSIRNNHLYNQTLEASTQYDFQFVIIECYSIQDAVNEYYYNTGVNLTISQINGAVSSLNKFSTVLFAQVMDSAFDLMERQAKKILEDKPLTWKYGKKSINPALNFLGSIKGLSKQAHLLCKKLNLNSLEDLMELTEQDLLNVTGIGKKKAQVILKAIHGEHKK